MLEGPRHDQLACHPCVLSGCGPFAFPRSMFPYKAPQSPVHSPHKWAVGTKFEWEFTFPMPTNPFYEPKPDAKPTTRKTGKAKATRNPARKVPKTATDAAKPKTSKKPKRVRLTPEERQERARARATEKRSKLKSRASARIANSLPYPGKLDAPHALRSIASHGDLDNRQATTRIT